MVTNPEFFNDAYKCNKHVMRYLVYTRYLPVLSVVGEIYYFRKTEALRLALENMPLITKVLSKL